MAGTKKDYVYTVARIKKLFATINEAENPDTTLVFLTNMGHIQGEVYTPDYIDTNSEDAILGSVKSLIKEGKNLDLFAFAEALYYNVARKVQEESDSIELHAITLRNAKIRYNDGTYAKVPQMILFSDQIIGIIPGELGEE
ncbi:hypothetical protein [Priestia megaterium]|uniref:hypothetical protein n=1 Tax=Priestia megaterium TaxID=1404 RepID=UPI0030005715